MNVRLWVSLFAPCLLSASSFACSSAPTSGGSGSHALPSGGGSQIEAGAPIDSGTDAGSMLDVPTSEAGSPTSEAGAELDSGAGSGIDAAHLDSGRLHDAMSGADAEADGQVGPADAGSVACGDGGTCAPSEYCLTLACDGLNPCNFLGDAASQPNDEGMSVTYCTSVPGDCAGNADCTCLLASLGQTPQMGFCAGGYVSVTPY